MFHSYLLEASSPSADSTGGSGSSPAADSIGGTAWIGGLLSVMGTASASSDKIPRQARRHDHAALVALPWFDCRGKLPS